MFWPALLAAGAHLDAVSEDGSTPLHRAAASNKNPVVVEALLAATANAKARDVNGKTPYDRAMGNPALRDTAVYGRLNNARF